MRPPAKRAAADDRSAARAEAERLWPVSADRNLRLRPGVRGGSATPAKAVLRKLMRWYVEPLAYDQRSFNAAALRLIDDLEARVAAARGRAEAALMRIAVCAPQVPFVRGGAEIMADTLVDELRARDHEAELVTVPFKWYPGTRVLDQAFLWRLLDLTESDGRADRPRRSRRSSPPTVVRHPNKRVWVLHQFRQAYELDRTDLGQFSEEPQDRALRRSVQRLDRIALGEAKRLFATSRNVAERIERSTGLAAEVLPHPPQELPYRNDGYGDFVLSVGRLDRAKRIDLLLEAAALDPGLRVVIAGDGPDRDRLEALAAERGLNGRAEFAGRVDEAELASLYARCLAVYYAPVDEDFGMVPYEAFLSEQARADDDRRRRAARGRHATAAPAT